MIRPVSYTHLFENGVPCSPQQGAGFVVAKSDEKTETACVEFLKWFTDTQQNTAFSITCLLYTSRCV